MLFATMVAYGACSKFASRSELENAIPVDSSKSCRLRDTPRGSPPVAILTRGSWQRLTYRDNAISDLSSHLSGTVPFEQYVREPFGTPRDVNEPPHRYQRGNPARILVTLAPRFPRDKRGQAPRSQGISRVVESRGIFLGDDRTCRYAKPVGFPRIPPKAGERTSPDKYGEWCNRPRCYDVGAHSSFK